MGLHRVLWLLLLFELHMRQYVVVATEHQEDVDLGKGKRIGNQASSCVLYEGDECPGMTGKHVWLPDEVNLNQLINSIQSTVTTFKIIAQQECKDVAEFLLCLTGLRLCQEREIDGVTYAMPVQPCDIVCEILSSKCPTLIELATQVGLTHELPNCATDRYGSRVHDLLEYYPEEYENQKSFGLTTFKGVDLECNTGNGTNTVVRTAVEDLCPYPFVWYKSPHSDSYRCFLSCPHSTYSERQYDSMFYVFVIPGTFGGLLGGVILVDSMRWVLAVKRGKAGPIKKLARSHVKSTIFKYQTLGSLYCVMWFLTGPLMSISYGYDVACNGIPVLEAIVLSIPEEIEKEESVACTISRVNTFVVMSILLVLLGHIQDSRLRVKRIMVGTLSPSRHKRFWPFALPSFLLPFFLYLIAGYLDHFDPNSIEDVQFYARNAFLCTPRLTPTTETLLLHVPLIGLACALFALTFDMSRKIKGFQTLEVTHLSDAKKRKGKKQPSSTERIGRHLIRVGFISAITIVLMVVSIIRVIPMLGISVRQNNDYYFCKLLPTYMAKRAILADSCEDFYNEVYDGRDPSSANVFDLLAKPPVAYSGLLYLSQALIPVTFGFSYLILAARKRKEFTRRVRRSKVQAATAPTVGSENTSMASSAATSDNGT